MDLQRFTHHWISDHGHVDLLAGDVTRCRGCNLVLFRDHAFLEEGEHPDGPTTLWGQVALVRKELPAEAERVGPRESYCEACRIDRDDLRDEVRARLSR